MRIIKERFAELEKKIKENNLDVDVDKIENAACGTKEKKRGRLYPASY